MAKFQQDKRHFRRVGCHLLSWIKNKADDSPAGATTTIYDISEGGVRFQSDRPLSPNDEYYLFLEIPEHAAIDVTAKPVWSWQEPHLKRYETGLSFTNLHPDDQSVIRELVSSKL